MSMKKWTDEELINTREKLESLNDRSKTAGSGSKMWLFTAFLGAFAVSTGIVFMFLDGVDVLNVILTIMGTVTCVSWYKSEKQRKDNMAFLAEINREIKSRSKKKEGTKPKNKSDSKTAKSAENEESSAAENSDGHIHKEGNDIEKKSEEK